MILTNDTRTFLDPATGNITVFDLDTCENCGGPVQAPNAVRVVRPIHPEILALLSVEELPPEQYYVEDLDGCACEGCNA